MAMQIHARNCMQSNPENKVGTNIESLAKFPREFIGGSAGYRASEFAESVALMNSPPDFHHLRWRSNQHGSAIARESTLAAGKYVSRPRISKFNPD